MLKSSLALALASVALATPAWAYVPNYVTFTTNGRIIEVLIDNDDGEGEFEALDASIPTLAVGDIVTLTATYDANDVYSEDEKDFYPINSYGESFQISTGSIFIDESAQRLLPIDPGVAFSNGAFLNFYGGLRMGDGAFYFALPDFIDVGEGEFLPADQFLIGVAPLELPRGDDGGRVTTLTVDEPIQQVVGIGEWNSGGVVPEPATWAMLIAGFGLVGGMLRRRRPLAA